MKQPAFSILNFQSWLVLFMACLLALPAYPQSRWQQFKQLNGPMRSWVALHPFVAKEAQAISVRSLALTDSMKQTREIGADYNGGQLDAFRHGVWMALLVQELPAWKAASLGRAYERGNRQDWRRGKLEDGGTQDAVAREMDLRNNKMGRKIGLQFRGQGEAELVQGVLDHIFHGQFCRVLKNNQGQCLDVNCQLIPDEEWQGHWKNRRCLQVDNHSPCI